MVAETHVSAIEPTHSIQRLCRYLSEQSPQPTVAVEGPTHVVTYLNAAFARFVGKESKDLISRPFAEAVPEGIENGCLALLDRVLRSGVPEHLVEQEHLHAEPGLIYWSYVVWAIIGEDDRPAGVMIQVMDATETATFRRQAMAMNEALLVSSTRQHELAAAAELLSTQLQAAVKIRNQFLAVLSHELRNPLSALTNGLRLLDQAGKDPQVAANSRAMMERQLNQMVRLVDELLDVSRIATGKLELRKELVDLASVVRQSVEASRPMIDREGHELTVTMPSEPIMLNADPVRLAQVFLNLLNNAAKYSDRGSNIWLAVKLDGNEIVVSVRDTGIGIPASHLPHVFDVFVQVDTAWQRSQGGLGIGLSLVKEFVGLHGGRVEAHSDGPGKGSEFIVYLPAVEAMVASEPPAPTIAEPSGPWRRILVVDDNRDAAESLALILRILGHEVRTANDGLAGVAAAADFRPHVILMDLGMPRVDGYEAARRIRAETWGKTPFIIALTGWGADQDRRRTRDAGFDRHLIKPVELDALTKMFAELPIEPPRA